MFFLFYKKSKVVPGLVLIAGYVLANFLINIAVIVTSNSNAFLYEFLTLIEYLLFTWFIYNQVKSLFAKKILAICSILFFLFFVFYTYILVKNVTYIDSVPIGVETILMLSFSFYYLYEQTNDTTTFFIYSKFPFWVILGIVLYLSGSFFIYIFADTIAPKEMLKYWFITNVFAILKNIFFSIAIYINAKPSKESLKYNVEMSSLN